MEKKENAFVLTCVRVVCRRVEALPHVVELIQRYTENISPDALTEALNEGDFHLFDQILQAVDESSNMVYQEKLRQYRYAMHIVVHDMPVEAGKLKAIKKLYARYPGSVDSVMISNAVQIVELPVLKWLHSVRKLSSKKFNWSDEVIFHYASNQGRGDVVRWLITIFSNSLRSLEDAASNGHLELTQWLMNNANWDRNSLKSALRQAIVAGHLTTAKHLYKHNHHQALVLGILRLILSK